MKQRIDNILFNGYVREPLPMVIIASVVGLAFLFFSIWATSDLFFASPPKSSLKEVVFIEYEQDGPIYKFLSSDGYSYDLPTNSIDSISLIDELVYDALPVIVEYALSSNEDAKSCDILSISSISGQSILSADIISKARLNNAYTSAIIMWITCICYIIFITTSYYVVSNAPRFPRIASILIREPFRNF